MSPNRNISDQLRLEDLPSRASTAASDYVRARVRKLRREHGWTRPHLVARLHTCGYNYETRALRYLEARGRITVDDLIALAAAFGLHWSALMPHVDDDGGSLDHEGLAQALRDLLDRYEKGPDDGDL